MRIRNPLAGFGRVAAGLVLTGTVVLVGTGVALAAGVTMVDDDFNPAQITIASGETVSFTNQGESPHTATADDGSFDTGTVDPGGSASVAFDTPGTYGYYCLFHGGPGGDGMAGVITVTGTGGGGSAGGNAGGTGGGDGNPQADDGEAAPILPQTATPLPLIAGAGVLLLGTGLWLGRRRRAA
jgi:LPXTG-motif cell wall-anchored protein